MVGTNLLNELARWIDRRIHIAPKTPLGLSEGRCDVSERHAADDQQVDVAPGAQGSFRCGPVNKRDADRGSQWCQGLANYVDCAGDLEEQLLQLGEDRRLAIGLEVHLPAIDRSGHETGTREQLKLALHSALGSAGLAHKLAQVESFVRMPVQPNEHVPAGLSEQERTGLCGVEPR